MSVSDAVESMEDIDSTMGIEYTELTTQQNVLSSNKGRQAAAGRATSDSNSSNNNGAFTGGMIAGTVAGSIGGICLCCCCLFCFAKMCAK